ncbi:sugar ABC transporter substrate-binding protein [Paenibacillus glufosinatiresistens]|uniref:sugar ABC transporter substrate-binding protein n=1 Tax=Paenibacillus glufosinatiresistens TaxID=3070657 RepID=UPI00286E206E|nr:extracellular solute-binding protein [Paenibacillus sp. YX.27]
MNSSKNTGTKPIVVWHEFDGKGDTSIEVLESICRDYSAERGLSVVPEVMNITELGIRLRAISDGGPSPMAALVPADLAGYGGRAQYSQVPDSFWERAGITDDEVIASMRPHGCQYGVPILRGNHLVLYFNREIYPEAPGSWEELTAAAEGLRARGVVPLGADLKDPYCFIPFLTACGGWPLKNGEPDLASPEMAKALELVRSGLEQGVVESLHGPTALLDRFIAGEVGAIICGEWIFNYLHQHMENRLDVASLPSIGGNRALSMTSSIGLVFPGEALASEQGEELLELAAYMLSEEKQREWATRVQRIPVHPGVRAAMEAEAPPVRARLIRQMANTRSMPVEPVMEAVWEAMREGLLGIEEQEGVVTARFMQEQAEGRRISAAGNRAR